MKERKRVQKIFKKPSLTKQCFKAQCDATNIVRKFRQVNQVDLFDVPVDRFGGTYIDCTEVPDYQGSLELKKRAVEQFYALPAKIREYYGNDPVVFAASYDAKHFEGVKSDEVVK